MAERRMFAKTIIDSDAFLDMPLSTQALYFHLSMRADDDGFVNSPKKISKMIGASDDELKVLFAKKFIIGFESGVVVIKHWKIHNYIQKDRKKDTNYHEEMAKLGLDKNNGYTMDTECVQDVSIGKVRLGEDRVGKVSIEEKKVSVKTESYDDSIRLANYLLNNILKYNPTFKKPNINTWANDIDKAIRIDHRSVSELKECIDWIYSKQGEFWQKNILSGKKLREKFDTMNMQVITAKPTRDQKKLSKQAETLVNVMKKRGHSQEEIEDELRKMT